MSALEPISLREFARRESCDEKIVRRKIASGHLKTLPDGKLNAAFVGTGWRVRKASADSLPASALSAPALSASPVRINPDETPEQAAERIVFQDGRVFPSEAEAKRHKESFLALMRELDYDRENGSVVSIIDVVLAVAAEYALVRTRLLNIATRVAPRAAMLRSAEEVRALIDEEVALALKELSLDAGQYGDGSGGAGARDAIRARFKKPH